MTIYTPTAAQILTDAIRAVEAQGYARGRRVDARTGALCLSGAVDWAAGVHALFTRRHGETRGVALTSPWLFDEQIVVNIRVTAPAYAAIYGVLPDSFSDRRPGFDDVYRKDRLANGDPYARRGYCITWNDTRCDGAEDLLLVLKQALSQV